MKLLIQDEDNLIHHTLEDTQVHTTLAKNSQWAMDCLKETPFDLVVCDTLEVLKAAKESRPQTVVVMATPFASVEKAIEAMRLGAFDYVVKPISPKKWEQLLEQVENVVRIKEASPGVPIQGQMEQIIAESSIMKQILSDIAKVAKSHASVFISGESGTGKEVVAQTIHFLSLRASLPFIKVNCAAVPETLIESEFFGHEKGAFTGALDKRIGRFELAHRGTLLLDEISEIPLAVQAKLLRVVQEQEFERVGGNKPIKVDVRLISTSNRDMKKTIEEKLFREDLYYRLNVVPIDLPPLRERREDILSLAEEFLVRLCEENHKKRKRLSAEAKAKLLDYYFPGNIRELANIIERTVVMDAGEVILPDHLRLDMGPLSCPVPKELTLAEVEKEHILEVLAQNANDRRKAAKTLGISLRTLRHKLQSFDLGRDHAL
jgi:two-component system response regulator AtoC